VAGIDGNYSRFVEVSRAMLKTKGRNPHSLNEQWEITNR